MYFPVSILFVTVTSSFRRSALAEQDVKFWMTYLTAEEKLVEDQLGSSPAVVSGLPQYKYSLSNCGTMNTLSLLYDASK